MNALSKNTPVNAINSCVAVLVLPMALASIAITLASLYLSYKSVHVTKTASDLDYIALATAFLAACLQAYRTPGTHRITAIALAVVLLIIAVFHYKNDPYHYIHSDTLGAITTFTYYDTAGHLLAPRDSNAPSHNNPTPITEWQHGFKTDRVVATRYTNVDIGYNIGFRFPKDPDNADRAEVVAFMEAHQGWVFQGGGHPGAEVLVKFSDVADQTTADKKLKEILPPLDKLMADMAKGSHGPDDNGRPSKL